MLHVIDLLRVSFILLIFLRINDLFYVALLLLNFLHNCKNKGSFRYLVSLLQLDRSSSGADMNLPFYYMRHLWMCTKSVVTRSMIIPSLDSPTTSEQVSQLLPTLIIFFNHFSMNHFFNHFFLRWRVIYNLLP